MANNLCPVTNVSFGPVRVRKRPLPAQVPGGSSWRCLRHPVAHSNVRSKAASPEFVPAALNKKENSFIFKLLHHKLTFCHRQSQPPRWEGQGRASRRLPVSALQWCLAPESVWGELGGPWQLSRSGQRGAVRLSCPTLPPPHVVFHVGGLQFSPSHPGGGGIGTARPSSEGSVRCIQDVPEKHGSYCSNGIKTANGIMRQIIFKVSFVVWKLPHLTAREGTGTCWCMKGKMQWGHRSTGVTATSLSSPWETETSFSASKFFFSWFHCFLGKIDSREQLWQQWQYGFVMWLFDLLKV